MKARKKLIVYLIGIAVLIMCVAVQAQRNFVFMNQSGKDIWVGCQGNPLPANGGFYLAPGAQRTVTVPTGATALRFWGRTGCKFDANGNGTCESGDCGRGLSCGGAGGIPPATLAEFTLDAANAGYQDFYDISLVDGYNLPMRIVPVPGTFTKRNNDKYECGIAGCTSDLNITCPPELQVKNLAGQVVGCQSACMKYNTNAYCCTGPNNTPQTCPPTNYSNIFKAACPDAYSYAYDDQTSTFICTKATYQIIFGTGSTPPPTGVSTSYRDCNYTGASVALPTGDYNLSAMISRGLRNDDISSITVNSGYEVQLFEHDNFAGASTIITANNSCLVGAGWNDRVSSMKVRTSAASFSRLIQAESYNAMAGVQIEATTDVNGGQNVGYIDNGDWMAYNSINFPSSGTYRVEYRVASLNGGNRISLDLNAGSIQLGAVNVPSTGGWQNWTTISHNVNVNAGTYNLGVFAAIGGFNLNWIRITKLTNARTTDDMNTADNGESDYSSLQALDIHPNPAEQTLSISSSYDLNSGTMRIVDRMGHDVYNGPSTWSIDVSNYAAGIYTLIFNSEGHTYSKRFIKR